MRDLVINRKKKITKERRRKLCMETKLRTKVKQRKSNYDGKRNEEEQMQDREHEKNI